MKNFYRKVAFGLKPDEKEPSEPLVWAQKHVETIPEFNWKGKYILSEKEVFFGDKLQNLSDKLFKA